MLRYAITDRHLFGGTEREKRSALVRQAERLAAEGIAYLQIREKDLSPEEMFDLAVAVRAAVRAAVPQMRVLLNGSMETAMAAGVEAHLPFSAWATIPRQGRPAKVASISCHSANEVEAASAYADVLLFGPVFEKRVRGEMVRQGTGLPMLSEACRRASGTPVLALGGITHENAHTCMVAGASGIAGIRMFLR